MDDPFWGAFAVALCVVVSAVLAASEAALAALPVTHLRSLAEKDDTGHPGIDLWIRRRTRVGAAMRLILALSLALASITSALVALRAGLHPWQTGLIAVGVALVFAAVMTLADVLGRTRAQAMVQFAAKVVRSVDLVVRPVSVPFAALGLLVMRSLGGRRGAAPPVSEEQIEYLIELGKKQGVLTAQEEKMLTSVFDLADTMVREVMVPRVSLASIRIDDPVEDVVRQVLFQGHSRYPAYGEGADDVLGILHAKDLARAVIDKGIENVAVEELLRRPVFAPETQRIDIVLKRLQAQRVHIAVVVDEFGGTAGIVTIEDILEEIVGEIADHDEEPDAQVERVGDGRYLVDGAVSLRDLEDELGVKFPEDSESDTIGGFVVEQVGRVPDVGVEVRWAELSFKVAAGDERHVAKVEVVCSQRPPPMDEPSSEVLI